jgi:hypothetical protein
VKPARLRTLAALAAVCALLAGCAADRVQGLRASTAPQAAPAAGACPFTIVAIDDRREEKGLGRLYRTRVDGEESFPSWFADGLKATPGHAAQGAPVTLRVEVLRAYIHALSTMKSANLVVRVHMTTPDGALRSKLYRGVDGSTNWSNSESEVQAAFDNAMIHLRQQLQRDLALTCTR